MDGRRAKGTALRQGDRGKKIEAMAIIDEAKRALGERGPVWWQDGAPDYNRRLVADTPYAGWYAGVGTADRGSSS